MNPNPEIFIEKVQYQNRLSSLRKYRVIVKCLKCGNAFTSELFQDNDVGVTVGEEIEINEKCKRCDNHKLIMRVFCLVSESSES